MQVLKGIDNLKNVILSLEFRKSFSSFAKIIQSLVGTKLEEDVYVFAVFENVFEFNYVSVVK
jgi:hypothetical protein